MFLAAKENEGISVSEEFKGLRNKVTGPFLGPKKTIDISAELRNMVKKFEKRFETPIKPQKVEQADLSTVKVERQKSIKQSKILNMFNIQKPPSLKTEKTIP